jgi:O-antigen/teichoic acid export membrane protein
MVDDSSDNKAILEEYKTLRTEILQWQNQRVKILSLVITAMAGLLSLFGGLLLNSSGDDPTRISLLSIVGSLAMYVILIPLELLLISSHRQVSRIGKYIRVHIEPKLPGLEYESRLLEDRPQSDTLHGIRSMGKVCLALSIVPLVLPAISYVMFSAADWSRYAFVAPFFMASVYMAFDLWFTFSKKWHINYWIKPNNSHNPLLQLTRGGCPFSYSSLSGVLFVSWRAPRS